MCPTSAHKVASPSPALRCARFPVQAAPCHRRTHTHTHTYTHTHTHTHPHPHPPTHTHSCTPGRDYTCRAASRTEVLPRRLHTWDVCKQMAIERESVRYTRACAQAHLDLQVHECAFDADRNLRVHVQLYT